MSTDRAVTEPAPSDDPFFASIQIGDQLLPGAWRYLLPEDARWLRLPGERWSRCDPCFRAAVGDCRDDARCCTYLPSLPNFMLGLALIDPGAGDIVGPVLDRGQSLPPGLAATPEQLRAALKTNAADRFGQETARVCPFLRGMDGGYGCALHCFRNSICATFFCEHTHGQQSVALWDAIQALVGLVESVIAQWAMTEVGLDSAAYFAKLDDLSTRIDELSTPGGWSQAAREHLWGEWFGRERAFFEACAERVMARRDDLYAIACMTPLHEARAYERAVYAWVPEALRAELPALSVGEVVPVEALWYGLQLKIRQLWELPLSEGALVLAPSAVIGPNPRDDRISQVRGAWPEVVDVSGGGEADDGDDERVFLTAAEARVLRLFDTPQFLGERLFARPEVEALEDARRFFSECMRRGVLRAPTKTP